MTAPLESSPLPGFAEVIEVLSAGLTRAAAAVELDQAVRGIDSRSELELQALLREALQGAGFGALPEVRYPADRGRSRRSEGRRCDLVVTPHGLPLDEGLPQLELFRPAASCRDADALWIEVKVVAQFVEGGANSAYSGALQAPLFRDVRKLASDPGIGSAALLVLLFTVDSEVAGHDLETWARLGRSRALPIGEPLLRSIPIVDRLGNALLTVALFPVLAGSALAQHTLLPPLSST